MACQGLNFLKHPEGEVSGATTQIQDGISGTEMVPGTLRDELKSEGRINRRLLTGFKTAEPLDIAVKARSYFLNGGFVLERG